MENEDPLASDEATKRVLFHLVTAYQAWRDTRLGVPNEFTDNAVLIGEKHLRLIGWFPEDAGWLAELTDASPTDTTASKNIVLRLIDKELTRLRTTNDLRGRGILRKLWWRGVLDARTVAAEHLRTIRAAYVTEALTREAEALGLYSIEDNDDV